MYRNTTQLQLDPTQATAPSESLVPQGASIALILMAAGSSSRFAQSSPKTHAIKKQWLRIGEKPLWLFVADTLSAMYPFVQIRITASEQEASYMQKLCSYEIVIGGETRQESLRNALQGIESEWVLVSDVARAGIVAVARKIISALIVTSLDSSDNAQTQSKQRAASLEKVDSRGNVDCHAAAHAAARNDSKNNAPHAIARNDGKNTLDSISIIIPCFNEKSTITDILQAVQSVQIPYHKEIVIIDDCSTDGTREILATLQPSQENCSLKILYHDKNQGKGAALRTGITQASGDLVLIQDADLEYDPSEYPKLLAPFEKGVADVVFGSRFVSGESHRVLYFWHRMGNGLLTLLSNMMTNLNLTDMETCYKVFKREIIQSISIEENRFGFEPEITAKIAKIKGIRIYEVGISYYGRTYEEGKKIGIKDGFRALWAIVKYRFKG